MKNLTYKKSDFEKFSYISKPQQISSSWFGEDSLVIYATDQDGNEYRIEAPWREINNTSSYHATICWSC